MDKFGQQLAFPDVEHVYLCSLPGTTFIQTDVLAEANAALLLHLNLSVVLVPASTLAREIFARVAAKLQLGMTADCTSLIPEARQGQIIVHQRKPSFGSQVMVECDLLKQPQIITISKGAYEPARAGGKLRVEHYIYKPSSSQISLVELIPAMQGKGIQGAEIIVCAGKGAMEGENFSLLQKYAAKIGATLAGSRPMAEKGWIDFNQQIGMTGTVVRPKVCIIFGVSGAIQFTEGIKGNPLIIAINKDAEAPIFQFADYGIVADMHDLLLELLK